MFSKDSTNIRDVYNSKYTTNLISILEKLLKHTNITMYQFIELVTDDKYNDAKLVRHLQKLNKKDFVGYSDESDKYRAFGKWKIIKHIIPKYTKSILDFGGNVGNVAHTLGHDILKLPKEKIYCVDIDEWAGKTWKPRSDITWIHADNLENIPDNSVDVITCFHVLHHIQNNLYKNILSNLYRILSKNGVMILYEHNGISKEWNYIIELEHMLYDVVLEKKISFAKFIKTHYSKYLNIENWRSIFNKHNFKGLHVKEMKNLDNSFYLFAYK